LVYISREEVYSGYTEVQEEVVEDTQIRIYMPNTRKHVLEQPYDMFCIPYGELNCGNNFITVKDVALLAGRTIAKAGIGQNQVTEVYDVQLLPYCPVRDLYTGDRINLASLTNDVDYTYITDQFGNNMSVAFWCRSCDFSFDIPQQLTIPTSDDRTYAESLKISNECDLYRISSPNYSGSFDFSLAKMGGSIDYFNVDCTYKPFNPYIHVNPNFKGLYGSDFDDARGLICGGDFSIAIVTDQWAQYELQNKNYQQIFQTNIGSLDATKTLQKNTAGITAANEWLNSNALKTFNGAISGGVAGAIFNAVESTISTGVNLGTSLYNISETNRIQKEYLTNNYVYSLGNIRALPPTLSKSNAFTRNNKLYPFIEIFTATDREKTMLLNKIRYDGMTVMAIGKLSDYIYGTGKTFVKGEIIRLEGISDDTHILNDIYSEIKKGVYL